MAIDRVAVKAEFRVQNFQIAGVGHDQRVDLQHLHVFVDEGLVELTHQLDALLYLRAFKAEREGNAAAVIRLIAGGRIDGERQDLFRGLCGDLFDVHAALGGAHKRHARGHAVHQQRQIEFGLNAGTCFDVDAVDLFARRAGLVGHKGAAQHLLGFFSRFFDRFGQAHAAFFSGVGFLEGALAATTCVDLGLHDP